MKRAAHLKIGSLFVFANRNDYEKIMVARKIGENKFMFLLEHEVERDLDPVSYVFEVFSDDYIDENEFKISVKY